MVKFVIRITESHGHQLQVRCDPFIQHPTNRERTVALLVEQDIARSINAIMMPLDPLSNASPNE
jgi:hypothetical protein